MAGMQECSPSESHPAPSHSGVCTWAEANLACAKLHLLRGSASPSCLSLGQSRIWHGPGSICNPTIRFKATIRWNLVAAPPTGRAGTGSRGTGRAPAPRPSTEAAWCRRSTGFSTPASAAPAARPRGPRRRGPRASPPPWGHGSWQPAHGGPHGGAGHGQPKRRHCALVSPNALNDCVWRGGSRRAFRDASEGACELSPQKGAHELALMLARPAKGLRSNGQLRSKSARSGSAMRRPKFNHACGNSCVMGAREAPIT